MKNTAIKNIIILESIDSTNNYANELIKKLWPKEGTIIVASEQKKGKGHQGNAWESEPGKNLTFSMILYPEFIFAEQQFVLSKAVCLALTDLLERLISEVTIKWPNDIYYKNFKIAGILIENGIKRNKITYSVIGIGLNCNQEKYKKSIPNPVSLRTIINSEIDLHALLAELKKLLLKRYNELQKSADKINSEYLQKLYRINIESEFISNGEKFTGIIKGVDEWGRLLIATINGELKSFNFKEVRFVEDIYSK